MKNLLFFEESGCNIEVTEWIAVTEWCQQWLHHHFSFVFCYLVKCLSEADYIQNKKVTTYDHLFIITTSQKNIGILQINLYFTKRFLLLCSLKWPHIILYCSVSLSISLTIPLDWELWFPCQPCVFCFVRRCKCSSPLSGPVENRPRLNKKDWHSCLSVTLDPRAFGKLLVKALEPPSQLVCSKYNRSSQRSIGCFLKNVQSGSRIRRMVKKTNKQTGGKTEYLKRTNLHMQHHYRWLVSRLADRLYLLTVSLRKAKEEKKKGRLVTQCCSL